MFEYFFARAFKILFAVLFGLLFGGLIVMWLWNALMPAVFDLPELTFIQSAGILLLSKILFSDPSFGFDRKCCGCGGRSHHQHWKSAMRAKMAGMPEAEREALRKKLSRCGWNQESDEKSE